MVVLVIGVGIIECILLFIPQIRDAIITFGEDYVVHRPLSHDNWHDNMITWSIYFLRILVVSSFFYVFSKKYMYSQKIWEGDIKKTKYLCLIFFFLVVVFNAWQADDGYLSHKVSYNFAIGNGIVFNAGERVLVSTCPLHTIIIGVVYKLFGHIYLSSLVVCILYSVGAATILLWFQCKNNSSVILATVLLILCRSFISFTTSGLENSLLFLLFAILLHLYLSHDLFGAKHIVLSAFLTSLILLTRMDTVLIALPLIGFIIFKRKTTIIKALLYIFIGILPFIAWEIFSILYYGFPFPNTVYAKLGTNFPLIDYISRGIRYFIGTSWGDALVLALPILFMVLSFIGKSHKHQAISLGLFLYYLYIVYIGGDFMFGRHFTVSFFMSLFCILPELDKRNIIIKITKTDVGVYLKNKTMRFNKIIILIFVSILCLQGVAGFIHLPFDSVTVRLLASGHDERNTYFPYTSLISRVRKLILNNSTGRGILDWNKDAQLSIAEIREKKYKGDIITYASGILMVYFCDGIYVNDRFALGDPFLARLPAKYEKGWYIGHMVREIPAGYRESIQTGENHIVDPDLHEYLDILWDIIRSDSIFTKDQIEKIININLGKYDYLLARYLEKIKNNI
jgi:arabinofuranosyltransferase